MMVAMIMFVLMFFPIILTIIIVYQDEQFISLKSMLINEYFIFILAINLAFQYMVSYLIADKDMLSGIWSYLNHKASYQDIIRWYSVSLISVFFSIVFGLLYRRYITYLAESQGTRKKFYWGRKKRARKYKAYKRVYSLTRKKIGSIVLMIAVYLIPVSLGIYSGVIGTNNISIKEICRKENGKVNEPDMTYFVLANNGDFACELEGMYLSTDKNNKKEYRIPDGRIAAKGEGRIEIPYYRAIEISKNGDSKLYLSNQFGEKIDSVSIPSLTADTSYRLTDDGWKIYDVKSENDQEYDEIIVDTPLYSAKSGFYDSEFDLELSATDNEKIYYTLDGSVPTIDSEEYQGPIRVYNRSSEPNQYRSIQNVQEEYSEKEEIGQEPVDKAFIVRSIAVDAEGRCSEVSTRTFFIGLNQYKDDTVISLVADPEDLFGEEGIYITGAEYDQWYERMLEAEESGEVFDEEMPELNYMKRGEEWERDADFELFEGAESYLNQHVGIRMQGFSSRRSALKRFSIYSRKMYSGANRFDRELFDGKETHSVVLRTGFNNAFSNALVTNRDVAALGTKKVVAFLNGEFWYETYMQEKYCSTFFSQTFGVNKDNVQFITIGLWSNMEEKDQLSYNKLINLVKNADLSDDNNYAKVDEVMDIQSYIDYSASQVILGNADAHEKLNVCVWKTIVDEHSFWGDGRWRWAFYDMDFNREVNREVNGYKTNAQINSFRDTRREDWPPLLAGGEMWESFKTSPVFCKQFVLTFMDLINTNFEINHVAQMLEEWGEDISYDDYFYRDRPAYITQYMADEFGLAGTQETITLHVDNPWGGTVQLNTINPNLSSGEWSGKYYTDYPVTLTAKPVEGHSFGGWLVDGVLFDSETIEVDIKKGGSRIDVIFN